MDLHVFTHQRSICVVLWVVFSIFPASILNHFWIPNSTFGQLLSIKVQFITTLPSRLFHGGFFWRAIGSLWLMLVPFWYPLGTLLVPFYEDPRIRVLSVREWLRRLLIPSWASENQNIECASRRTPKNQKFDCMRLVDPTIRFQGEHPRLRQLSMLHCLQPRKGKVQYNFCNVHNTLERLRAVPTVCSSRKTAAC